MADTLRYREDEPVDHPAVTVADVTAALAAHPSAYRGVRHGGRVSWKCACRSASRHRPPFTCPPKWNVF